MEKATKVTATELVPAGTDTRASYYRKAYVLDDGRGTRYLRSYETVICSAGEDGRVRKYAEADTKTTRRHLGSFLRLYGPAGFGRRDFDLIGAERSEPRLLIVA